MTDHHKDAQRGREASQLLENALIQEAFSTIRENVLAKWEASKSADKEGREDAWKMIHAMNEFKRYFVNLVQTGKIAEHEISLTQKLQSKVSNLWK